MDNNDNIHHQNKVQETKNNIIDENQIEEIAKFYLCIGGKWFKKSFDPLTNQEELYPIIPSVIIDNEGHPYPKEIAERVRKIAPQYLAKTNSPSHIDYKECIINGIGDRFYNEYRPIGHIPEEGTWAHIEELLRHIFGEQYEMGLDYIQLLYMKPLQQLPILLLVSQETGTGKSTFCKFLKEVFGSNALPLTTDILENRFNSYWTGKLLVYVEEQESDSKEVRKQSAKLKNTVTAETLPSEGKGKDAKATVNFVKVIICSNDEISPIKIEPDDTRYWVRKISSLSKEQEAVDILQECRKEIPAFLFYLLNRQIQTKRVNRLWFSPNEIHTAAWQRIVAGSRDPFELSLVHLLVDTMDRYGVDELMYSKTELNNIVRCASQFSDSLRRKSSDLQIRNILRGWGLKASAKNVRHDVYELNWEGDVKSPIVNRSSNAYVITRELLLDMIR